MKCEISKEGMLVISATNELESYALGQWLKENLTTEYSATFSHSILFNTGDSEYNKSREFFMDESQIGPSIKFE